MIQQYLFIDDTHRTAVENYSPERIEKEIYDIDNSNCWIVTYSLAGENEDSARRLSEVNDYVLLHFQPTVLTNESSFYFNKKLFPIINAFERKLRKLLYLKSALYHGDMKVDNIRNLEAKDIGEIFTILFSDAEFVKNAKTKVNDKTWQFTKKEIISTLQSLVENTVWDALIGNNTIEDLVNNFICVKDYRNDVMHAHNIDTTTYRAARRLFTQINEQIDAEIGTIIQTVEIRPETVAESDYNAQLSTVLRTHSLVDSLSAAEEMLSSFKDVQPNSLMAIIKQIEEETASINYRSIEATMNPILDLYNEPKWLNIQKDLVQNMTNLVSPMLDLQQQMRDTITLTTEAQKTLDVLRKVNTSSLSEDILMADEKAILSAAVENDENCV